MEGSWIVYFVISFVAVNHIGQSLNVCGPSNRTISLVYEYEAERTSVIWRRNGIILDVVSYPGCDSNLNDPKYKFSCENGGLKYVLEVNNPVDGEVYYTGTNTADNRTIVIQDKGSFNINVNEDPFLCQLTDAGVQLVCSVGCSKPEPKLSWKFTSNMGGTLQDLSGGVESINTGCSPGYVSKTNTITISNTTPVLGGLDGYTLICEASYPDCDIPTTTDQLNRSCSVRPVVHIEPSTNPHKVIEGGQLVLTCEVTNSDLAVPSDVYTWNKNGVKIIGQSSSIYRIESVDRSDNGSYTCTGSNSIGTGRSSTPVQLDVLYGPMVTASVDSVTKTENDDLQLICTVESNPPSATLKWYKPDGSSVDVSSNGRLNITGITRNQGGIYRCEASSTLEPTVGDSITRSDNKTIDVTVLYLDPVTLLPTGDKLTVNEGNSTSITCSTNSNPVALVTWYNGTTQISSEQTNNNTFNIQHATCLDTGDYTCQATNTEIPSVQYNKTLEVFINCSPRQDTRVITTSTVSGNIRDIVQLVADVISYPSPTFTWYYSNITTGDVGPIYNDDVFNQIDTGISTNTYRSTLNINITSNIYYTSYTVNVFNNIGYTELEYQAVAQSTPDVPSNINSSPPSDDSICITWKPGFNGGDQQEFIVQHSVDNKTWTSSTPLPESIPDYCIENLQADTPYYIRVIASNIYGDSQPVYLISSNDSFTVQTLKQVVTSNPEPSNWGLIGGIIGGVVVAILVVVVVIIFIKRRRKQNADTENRHTVPLVEVPDRQPSGMIIDEVVNYVSGDEIKKDETVTYAQVNKENKTTDIKPNPESLYATVNKKNNDETTKSTKPDVKPKKSDTKPDKPDVKPKKPDVKPKKPDTKPKKPDTKPKVSNVKNNQPTNEKSTKSKGEAYENVGIFGDINGSNTNEYENHSTKPGPTETVYADLDFDGHQPTTTVRGQDDAVEYSGIDYTKRGPTQSTPPDSSDEDDADTRE